MTGAAGIQGVKRAAQSAALFTPFSLLAGVTSTADVERSGTSKGEVSFFYHNRYSKMNRKRTVILTYSKSVCQTECLL